MEAKHTPGPWDIESWGDREVTVIKRGPEKDEDVAQVLGGEGDTDEARDANARLIASAPDLLEALQNAALYLHQAAVLLGSKPEASWFMKHNSAARSAIAKATGAEVTR